MNGLGPLMNGSAISAIDWFNILSVPFMNGSAHWWMGRIDVWVRTMRVLEISARRERRKGQTASNEREGVTVVVSPRFEWIFVLGYLLLTCDQVLVLSKRLMSPDSQEKLQEEALGKRVETTEMRDTAVNSLWYGSAVMRWLDPPPQHPKASFLHEGPDRGRGYPELHTTTGAGGPRMDIFIWFDIQLVIHGVCSSIFTYEFLLFVLLLGNLKYNALGLIEYQLTHKLITVGLSQSLQSIHLFTSWSDSSLDRSPICVWKVNTVICWHLRSTILSYVNVKKHRYR